ncbi:NAD(P)-binding protein [Coniochaeta ligniaria NRRL 30616]|uniref:NAD(P)-binding protein n=1 Tax=Coniochaeta ligniaria NRRL 30616 TaxID=1408157 RepID=A0A1J7JEX1_9PEZI|nr:NAD(P)-binding protein [Coniochaeta ligniaria NRRL 30616]
MPSYLVTGANRGIGLAFVRRLSENKDNIVVGFVRTQPAADSIQDLAGRDNLHWVHGELEDRESINAAVPKVSAITGGKLDVLIANAGIVSKWSPFDGLTELVKQDPAKVEEELLTLYRVNCLAQIFLISAFIPLIKAGTLKKVVGISTGFTVIDLAAEYGLYQAPLYSISKAAFNMAIAKLYAEHKDDGVLIMATEPGVVDTGMAPDLSDPEVGAKAMRMFQLFDQYAPHFKGPVTPDEAVGQVLDVVEKATFERNGGKLISHFGNEQWL